MEKLVAISCVVFIGAVAALKDTINQKAENLEVSHRVVKTESQRAQKIIQSKKMKVRSANELAVMYDDHGFDVDEVRKNNAPVPSIHLASLPKDIKRTPHTSKKDQFVQIMLPLILDVNQKVMAQRERLKRLKKNLEIGIELAFNDEMWLQDMADRYRVKSGSIDELLIKVDIIPPSLALAQASLESGWLMSAAARNKNSTFGHMASKKDVQGFNDLYTNVEAYILNLNRHSAYRDLRKLRADMRTKGKQICSVTLAKGLKSYSERGMAYIRDIQKMITQNAFKEFDTSSLDT